MWFNHAQIYHYELEQSIDLTDSLSSEILKPCPPHARFIYGWLPAFGDELVHETADCALICMGKEERVLPRAVIKRLLAEKIEHIEAQQNRVVKRAERSQLAEELEFELLPKSFCLQKRLPAILDKMTKRLIINTSSPTQAAQLISLLRKSISGISIEPIEQKENLSLMLANWITSPAVLPASFQLASNCVLFSPDDEKKRFLCKGYELPADEILTLLTQGLAVSEVSLI